MRWKVPRWHGCACAVPLKPVRGMQVNWTDDAVTRTRMELGSEDALTDHKGWQLRRYLDYAESEGGVCVLHLIADDPEVFAGLTGPRSAV